MPNGEHARVSYSSRTTWCLYSRLKLEAGLGKLWWRLYFLVLCSFFLSLVSSIAPHFLKGCPNTAVGCGTRVWKLDKRLRLVMCSVVCLSSAVYTKSVRLDIPDTCWRCPRKYFSHSSTQRQMLYFWKQQIWNKDLCKLYSTQSMCWGKVAATTTPNLRLLAVKSSIIINFVFFKLRCGGHLELSWLQQLSSRCF